jgi:hypothetical protein
MIAPESMRAALASSRPDAYCDPCGAPMWESRGDNIGTVIAYGIETVACEKCRGGEW